MAGQQWLDMKDKDKEEFVALSEIDKKRHAKQVKEREKKGFFTLADKTKSTDPANAKLFKKKVKAVYIQVELKPKRATSAYMYFTIEFFADTRESDPEMHQRDIYKLAGLKWQTLSDNDLDKFSKLNVADMKREENQL